MTRQDILTTEQMAEILQLSINTLQHKAWRERTGCPIRKIGKKLYSIKQDFEKWLRG